MTLTPEQKAEGWIEWSGGDCPIKDDQTLVEVLIEGFENPRCSRAPSEWNWKHIGWGSDLIAYRIIEAHGADAAPARPTHEEIARRLRGVLDVSENHEAGLIPLTSQWLIARLADEISPPEPKRETVGCSIVPRNGGRHHFAYIPATIDLIDGKPDLSTLKIAEDAL